MHEIVLSKNRLRDGAMVGRAMRAVKTLKKLDLSENEMSDLRQGSVQQSRLSSQFAFQCCNYIATTVEHSENCTILSPFAFQSSFSRFSKLVSNGE